jgi:hypothetical protein
LISLLFPVIAESNRYSKEEVLGSIVDIETRLQFSTKALTWFYRVDFRA